MSKRIALLVVSFILAASLCFAFGCHSIDYYYTVTFDSNGGTAIESVEVVRDRTVQQPADPTKVGYIFDGWYLGEEEYSFEQTIKGPITLTAKWNPATDTPYTVKHLLEKVDGTGYDEVVEDTEHFIGTTDEYTTAVAKSYVGFTALEIEQLQIAPDGSAVVEVKYNRNLINVTWIIDGVVTEKTYRYGSIPTIETPVKASDLVYDYQFAGWDKAVVAVTEEACYVASFNATYINYSVVFKGENGEIISEKNDYHYGDAIVAPADPVKASDVVYNYLFNGWKNAETVTGNVEYQATFTPVYVDYTVTFEAFDGSVISSKTDYHYGDEVIVPDHNVVDGYNYAWDKEILSVSGNAIYKEIRTPKTYSVELVANGGELASELTSYVYTVGAALPEISKVGHTFKGWFASSDFAGEAVTEISASELGDKTFYAKWEANTYNVTLVAGEGSLNGELTSYVYGVGAALPTCSKLGYTFEGWFATSELTGEAVTEIGADELGDITLYAKYVANKDTKYTVTVLAAQYGWRYDSGLYYVDGLTYVDRTQSFASVFGLNENNQAEGETDSIVDLTAVVAKLNAAKIHADSTLTGTILADGSLELLVKLDFDEEALGFKLSNIKLGKWSCENLTFTLDYLNGTCGLAIDGTIGNGKELFIELEEKLLVANYAAIDFIYYEKSASTATQILASETVTALDNTAIGHVNIITLRTNPADYINGTVNLMDKFASLTAIKQINVKFGGGGEKHIFIGGLNAAEYAQETVTYNVENGNIADVVKPLGTGVIGQADSTYIANNAGLSYSGAALTYTYTGSTVAERGVGIVIDLGGINVSDYKSIKFVYQIIAEGASINYGANVIVNNITLNSFYGGGQTVDVKALAEAKGVTSFGQIELSLATWSVFSKCTINLAYIELVVDENAPAHNKHYTVDFEANGGALNGSLSTYEETVGATLPTASKEGYTFAGWYENSDLSGEALSAISATASGNKTYYAKWEANTYEVSFNLNGGELDGALSSYVYGVGATLPTASKTGYTFGGWYATSDFSGSAITEIGASELGNKTFFAKWNLGMANYTVKVLVAQYAQGYASAMYFPGALTYVDKTSEYASLIGLGGEYIGETNSTVDISGMLKLNGVKLSADSVLSGVIAADGSLELVVKLDIDEEALGFKLTDLKIGEYSCDKLTFTLAHQNGAWGLAIDGTIGNGKEIRINVGGLNVADYASIVLNYSETSANINSQVAVISNGTASAYPTLVSGSAPNASVDLISKFAVSTIDEIRVKVLGGGEKHIFIGGLEKSAWKKESVTYSIANGNLLNVVKPLGNGSIDQVANHGFGSISCAALRYTYDGGAISDRGVGITMDLGAIKLSDYKTVKIVYHVIAEAPAGDSANFGSNILCGNTSIDSRYGGAQTVDVKALAEAKGVTVFDSLEISLSTWSKAHKYYIYVASIELELMPEILCDACGSTEVAHSACEFCGELTCVGDHSECKPVLCEDCGSKEVAHTACEFCGALTCVGDHSKCQNYTVTLVANGGSVEGSLTEYAYGTGATLPTATKDGYAFVGWFASSDFAGSAVSSISASDFGNKTFYAKFVANQDTPYSVKVLVAQYTAVYSSPNWVPGKLTYVEANEYASVIGLNGELVGETDSIVDISGMLKLNGVKLNADSVLSGVIAGDGSLELIVKLDFDSAALGFNVEDIVLGQYGTNDNALKFTLKYHDGAFGLAVDGLIQNARELCVPVGEIVLADYKSIVVNYYEMSSTTNTQISACSEVLLPWTNATTSGLVTASNPSEYVKASVDLVTKYASLGTIKQVNFRVFNECEKHIFIAPLQKSAWKKESVTYSIANGNLLNVAKPLGNGTIDQVANHSFGSVSSAALRYTFEGTEIANRGVGIVFDLGSINLNNYKTVKIIYHVVAEAPAGDSANFGSNILCGSTSIDSRYGGAQTVDVKALATAKGVTSFDSLEISLSTWSKVHKYYIYVASVELALNPQSVTYSVANGNIMGIATPLNGGTLSQVDSFNFNTASVSKAPALVYTYESATAISADHTAGVKFNLGNIELADYKSIKVVAYAKKADGSNANLGFVFCDGTNVLSEYGGGKEFDLVALATAKGLTSFSELEISLQGWAGGNSYVLYVAFIDVVVAE